ncbi:putative kinesin heavy chain isoform [Hordeum vulgare]|nr:putative kinesin heavy chain isoform [Hordeum vulgare]KAI4980876.1 hypothetical protein ZWY2020_021361 [Hordeum vulgare]
MVSWNDNETSDDSAAYYLSSGSSPIKIPTRIEDPNYAGVDDDLMVMCEHDKSTEKFVAFKGISTGRRFLACSLDEEIELQQEKKDLSLLPLEQEEMEVELEKQQEQ